MPLMRFLDSAIRHIEQWKAGERHIPEMGEPGDDHLGQAAWNLCAMLHGEEMIRRGLWSPEFNDAPTYDGMKKVLHAFVEQAQPAPDSVIPNFERVREKGRRTEVLREAVHPKVYVIAPISDGGRITNPDIQRERAKQAVRLSTRLLVRGFTPFVPHLTVAWQQWDVAARSFDLEAWLAYDFEWLPLCDAVLWSTDFQRPLLNPRTFPGQSGCIREWGMAMDLGIPRFETVEELVAACPALQSYKEVPRDEG